MNKENMKSYRKKNGQRWFKSILFIGIIHFSIHLFFALFINPNLEAFFVAIIVLPILYLVILGIPGYWIGYYLTKIPYYEITNDSVDEEKEYEYKNKADLKKSNKIVIDDQRNSEKSPNNDHLDDSTFHPETPKTLNPGRNSIWKVGILIAIILGAVWLFGVREEQTTTSHQTTTSTQSPSRTTAQPGFSAGNVKSDTLQYTMPSAGTNNVLSVAEIRWCIREGIRVDAMRGAMNTEAEIRAFMPISSDYNKRCSNYQYNQGSLSQAEREVEPYRNQIVSEAYQAVRQLGRSYQPSYPSASQATSTSSAPKKPNAQITREAQQLLTELGYNPGPVDGDFGRRTAAALRDFQRDIGVPQDGMIDKRIILKLEEFRQQKMKELSSKKTNKTAFNQIDNDLMFLKVGKIQSINRLNNTVVFTIDRKSEKLYHVYTYMKTPVNTHEEFISDDDLILLSSGGHRYGTNTIKVSMDVISRLNNGYDIFIRLK